MSNTFKDSLRPFSVSFADFQGLLTPILSFASRSLLLRVPNNPVQPPLSSVLEEWYPSSSSSLANTQLAPNGSILNERMTNVEEEAGPQSGPRALSPCTHVPPSQLHSRLSISAGASVKPTS